MRTRLSSDGFVARALQHCATTPLVPIFFDDDDGGGADDGDGDGVTVMMMMTWPGLAECAERLNTADLAECAGRLNADQLSEKCGSTRCTSLKLKLMPFGSATTPLRNEDHTHGP